MMLMSFYRFQCQNMFSNMASHDVTMEVRLAGLVSDLLAAEGKYHLDCWVQFKRKIQKVIDASCKGEDIDKHLNGICDDIRTGLSQGCIHDMSQIWEYYTNLCKMNEQEIPTRYLSRRQSFYEAVTQIVGLSASISRQLDPKSPLLLYPRDITNIAVSKTLKIDRSFR